MIEKREDLITNEVLVYLETIIQLSPEARQFLIEHLVRQEIKKNTILLKPGEICTSLWYISTGAMASYEKNGQKKSYNWIMMKQDIATSVISFFEGTRTEEAVAALSDCVIYTLPKTDLFTGLAEHPSLLMLTFILTIKYYCQTRKMESALRKKTPEELYDYLLKNNPELVNGFTREVLSGFMGISKAGLYKIMDEHKNKKPVQP